jgi:7-cyano-7-deazaguanine synthase in queuosine biosynthesis
MKEQNRIHKIFWTGGMDSTARLIKVLLSTKEPVQPHFVIRHEECTGHEINAQNNIRRAFGRKYPELKSNFLPTAYMNVDLIPRSEEIASQIKEIEQKVVVYAQYHILADYCHAFDIDHIDIVYERDEDSDPSQPNVSQFFDVPGPFASFRNPNAHLTKREAYDMAKEEGWDDLLKLTSFCRRPGKRGRPCGTCGPCGDTVKEGMGFRVPFIPRMKARILNPFRKFYRINYQKHDSHWLFKMIKRLFVKRF